MVLPADHVREARVHDLVDQHDVAEQHPRAQQQQHHGHADELRPGLVDQCLGRVVGDEADDAPDEGGDGHVEDAGEAAEQEQADDEPQFLAEVVAVERRQAVHGRRLGLSGGGVEQGFGAAEHEVTDLGSSGRRCCRL